MVKDCEGRHLANMVKTHPAMMVERKSFMLLFAKSSTSPNLVGLNSQVEGGFSGIEKEDDGRGLYEIRLAE